MSSVVQRLGEITQPRGGYLHPSDFDVKKFDDGLPLYPIESVHPSIVGLAVDYLTRFMIGLSAEDAFCISLQGAKYAEGYGVQSSKKAADLLLKNITGLDDKSISSACKLVTFDVWYRNALAAPASRPYNKVRVDKNTVNNISTMVKRSMTFFEKYGPVMADGFSFTPVVENRDAYVKMVITKSGTYGGYTGTVSTGDGDFLTEDTLWDFKVSKSHITSKHTLQLLMYYIMGKHSGQHIYDNISKLGIFNPRLNTVYTYDIGNISESVIRDVEKDVICY